MPPNSRNSALSGRISDSGFMHIFFHDPYCNAAWVGKTRTVPGSVFWRLTSLANAPDRNRAAGDQTMKTGSSIRLRPDQADNSCHGRKCAAGRISGRSEPEHRNRKHIPPGAISIPAGSGLQSVTGRTCTGCPGEHPARSGGAAR
jgi:hypothetical protein